MSDQPSTTDAPVPGISAPATSTGQVTVTANVNVVPSDSGPDLSAPVSLADAPPSGNGAGGGEEDGDDEETLVDFFEELIDEIKERQTFVASSAFQQRMTNRYVETTRAEFRDAIYELLLKLTKYSGADAYALDKVDGRLEDVEDELERQGSLLRAFVSSSIIVVALQLAKVVVERLSSDQEALQLAQEIINAVGQAPQVLHSHAMAAPDNGSAAPSGSSAAQGNAAENAAI